VLRSGLQELVQRTFTEQKHMFDDCKVLHGSSETDSYKQKGTKRDKTDRFCLTAKQQLTFSPALEMLDICKLFSVKWAHLVFVGLSTIRLN